MRQYQGAVFFVDILGIGALTRGTVVLLSEDYEAHGIKSSKNKNEHFFSAKLLIKFRKILNNLKKNKDVKVAQLSDCAFIWSEKTIPLIDAAVECMWELIEVGIFCRGGIAYGNIVEPDHVNSRLGEFILGEAATKAVDLERAGKGCRIFSDVELPSEISGKILFRHNPFVGNKNPNDCSVTDELRWYLFPEGISQHDYNKIDKNKSLVALMKTVSILRFSPMFRWNASNHEGEIHLASSIETISSGVNLFTDKLDYRMSSEHLLGHLGSNRSNQIRARTMKTWRSEILSVFKKKKPNKAN